MQHEPVTQISWSARHPGQVNVAPQPSDVVPQRTPSEAQVCGVQQLVPLQVWPLGQVGQVSVLPQVSDTEPHCAPNDEHVCGVQQVLLPVQISWPGHSGHVSAFPQPSVVEPQALRLAHVPGVQQLAPLQTWVLWQLLQVIVPPQPSGSVPQTAPTVPHVCGVQHVWLGRQISAPGHSGQVSELPQPSVVVPQALRLAQVPGVQQMPW